MIILGHGVDLVHVPRIQAVIDRQGENFTKRAFSEEEYLYSNQQPEPARFFAARFAAKEAFGKAMRTGIGASTYLSEVSVCREENGAPSLRLSGKCAELFAARGGKDIFLSLSHDGDYAIASVILWGLKG